MLGVKTVGNATLIAFDDLPILATDPWFGEEEEAYFGSWNLRYQIPKQEREDILKAKFIWFSHGHPDHLNSQSIHHFKEKQILLPDHVGGRIKNALEKGGFKVSVLPDRQWVELSPRIRVFCITTFIQDAALLVEVNGRLFVDLNDSGGRGCRRLIRKIAKNYQDSYMMTLSGYAEADMINFFTEEGKRIEPVAALNTKVGKNLSNQAEILGLNHVIPFSSFHQYQRKDSAWANKYVTPLEAYKEGFSDKKAEYIEPFAFIDCDTHQILSLKPAKIPVAEYAPEKFGDNWSDELEKDDLIKITTYFQEKEKLNGSLGFLNFRVGGKTHTINLGGPKTKGITFEVPRTSLMKTIEYKIFDDLLIGNFMKTTLHNIPSLYDPNFNFIVAKFGDNAKVKTKKDLAKYLAIYRKRVGAEWLIDSIEEFSKQIFRRYVDPSSPFYQTAKKAFHHLKK